MSALDCVPIKLKALPIDVHLGCKIYFKNPGDSSELSLLCEDQTITQKLLDRLKRAVFPESKVYIPREAVIKLLFDKGHDLDFSQEHIKAIRNLESPWIKKEKPIEVPKIPKPSKTEGEQSSATPKDFKPTPNVQIKTFQDKIKSHIELQKYKEVIKVYDEVKDSTEDMLTNAAETGKIDTEQSSSITQDIQSQVNNSEVSLIVRTINQIRTVDEYLHTHCLNVAYLNGLMGKWLGFDKERQDELVETGLFHDLGKLGMPPEIAQKTEGLTPEEFEVVKKHPVLSLEMLMKSGIRNKAVLEGVIQHHERVNGTGYPKGMQGREICEYARITAISDTYDAMVTKRIHADSHSPFKILHEFEKGGYSELDFSYVNIFISCMVEELKGKEIIMNNGSEAVVQFVNPSKLLYPIVELNGEIIKTDDEFYCARMKNIVQE